MHYKKLLAVIVAIFVALPMVGSHGLSLPGQGAALLKLTNAGYTEETVKQLIRLKCSDITNITLKNGIYYGDLPKGRTINAAPVKGGKPLVVMSFYIKLMRGGTQKIDMPLNHQYGAYIQNTFLKDHPTTGASS